ncbi:ABC transporter substrate-binding protein [Pseudothauera nasutitermitis]|uniref:ABC transporter substrate-binding protein n=1 Tax=Pseudothauera nasutitermitis TaxID=2565930 RepID=A0A4S4B3M2_9RHOO|nr:ABC transporter substrate-binding protein [Pseudothauera nasutitermitis]THF67277.1 ABC transporter substrate-binding protein [Pseudothauera nasutitermitis]
MTSVSRRDVLRAAVATGAASLFGLPLSTLAAAARGGVVVIGSTNKPRHLNPAVQSGIATMFPGVQIFAPLLTVDGNWKAHPYLAERWSISDDARSVTLQLRKDARFHDGRPVTSADVQFSIETVRDNHPFKSMLAPVNAITTPDAHTAIVRLAEPHPALELVLTTSLLPIIPKHIYGDGQPVPTHPRNSTDVIGSGPFRVVEFKPGEHVILERFKDFFLPGKPQLERIIIREYKDTASLLLALERGEIDVHPGLTEPRDIERAKKIPGVNVVPNTGPAIGRLVWLAFNTANPKLADKRVRQAINYAIDKHFIINTLFGGVHLRSTGPIAAGSPFYSKEVEAYELDLDKARQLLDAAGLRPGANGVRLALTVDAIPGASDQRAIQEYLKPALAKIGIDVSVRQSPDFPIWSRRISNQDFELTLDSVWNWGDPVIGVHRTWLTANIRKGVIWSNTQSYSNPRVDELLAAAGQERDAARRKALYREFQEIVVDDVPVAFLHEVNLYLGYGKRIAEPVDNIWGLVGPLDEFGLKQG